MDASKGEEDLFAMDGRIDGADAPATLDEPIYDTVMRDGEQ